MKESKLLEWLPVSVEPFMNITNCLETTNCIPEKTWLYQKLGIAAGTAYKAKLNEEDRCKKRVLQCIKDGHLSILEHVSFTFRITCDRGTSHALVRHRPCSFTQESTIYHKYNNKLPVIKRPETDPVTGKEVIPYTSSEIQAIEKAYKEYTEAVTSGEPAGLARDLLPNCTATVLTMTANLREWLWIMKLRCDKKDSVRMHQVAFLLREIFIKNYPEIMTTYELMNY